MYANNQRTEIAFASFHFILIFLADICTPRWVHASSRRQTILRGKVQSDALLPSGYSVFYNQKKEVHHPPEFRFFRRVRSSQKHFSSLSFHRTGLIV